MGDLGFFDEFDKEPEQPKTQKFGQPPKIVRFGIPPPNSKPAKSAESASSATEAIHLDKTGSKLERVIDGASLMRVTHI